VVPSSMLVLNFQRNESQLTWPRPTCPRMYIGILAASGQIPATTLDQYEFAAELALSGELRPISGILTVAIKTHDAGGGRQLMVASVNADKAALVDQVDVLATDSLLKVCVHRQQRQLIAAHHSQIEALPVNWYRRVTINRIVIAPDN